MVYKGIGNEYAGMTTYIDYNRGNRLQLRSINGGTTVGQVLENKNGELRLLYSKGEFYYRQDILNKSNPKPEILLKEPLIKGTSWTLPNGDKRYISAVNVEVKTSIGNFKCIEVTTKASGDRTLDYYGKGLGLIKRVFITNGAKITSVLENFKENVPEVTSIRFYYPDVTNGINVYLEHQISLRTNDSVKTYFERYFKSVQNKGSQPLLGEKTKINLISYDEARNMVHIDFSKNFIKEMNLASPVERMILTCITDTLGNYYNTNKVYITLEGKPYSSKHFFINNNKPFYVDYKNTQEYRK